MLSGKEASTEACAVGAGRMVSKETGLGLRAADLSLKGGLRAMLVHRPAVTTHRHGVSTPVRDASRSSKW